MMGNRSMRAPSASLTSGEPNDWQHFIKDRWILAILITGLLARLAVAIGLHQYFAAATPAHLWPGTDEATYYNFGLRSARIFHDQGWLAFIDSAPRAEYFNWAHFKYTGLVLFLAGDTPLTLRILSILFYMSGVILFCRSLGRLLPGKMELYFYTGVLALLPSTIFWSALAIKEGILTFMTGLLCWIVGRTWLLPKPWSGLSAVTLICLVMGAFRIWLGLACFGVFAGLLLFRHPGRPRLPILLPVAAAMIMVAAIIPTVQLLIAHNLFQKQPDVGMQINFPSLPLLDNLFLLDGREYPLWLKPFVAWLLPLPFLSDRSGLMHLAGFENLFILALSGLAIMGACRKLTPLEAAWFGIGVAIFLISTGFGTNLGTIYRIKGAIIPFLAYFAACGLPILLKRVSTRKR